VGVGWVDGGALVVGGASVGGAGNSVVVVVVVVAVEVAVGSGPSKASGATAREATSEGAARAAVAFGPDTVYVVPSKWTWTAPPGATVTGNPGDWGPPGASRTSPPVGKLRAASP